MKTIPQHLIVAAVYLFFLANSHAETIETRDTTGYASFIVANTPRSLDTLSDFAKAYKREYLSPQAASGLFIKHYATRFGIGDSHKELQFLKSEVDNAGNSMQLYRQLYRSLPILGAELRVNLDPHQALRSMNGQISPFPDIDTSASISPQESRDVAQTAFEKWYPSADPEQFTLSQPELVIYDPRLFSNHVAPARLVWHIELSSSQPYPIKELILVDARTGGVLLHFNQTHTALSREIYTANHAVEQDDNPLPVTLVCDESDPDCANGDADAQAAHTFTEDTYRFFLENHGRDSFDNQGGTLISVTHYGTHLLNAYWDSTRAIFGDGLARLDDVVAHELTHAFTEHTSKLYYYDQSGAINESLSDLWGEFIDLQNGKGDDSASVRWQIGEEGPLYSILNTSIRDMQNPARFNHPDKMTSPYYYLGTGDNRGVHINSGVNNKAVVLLVDGGTLNGKTVSALGMNKVSDIYYEAQTRFLGQTSTYPDLYMALQQACGHLIPSGKTTSQDCEQVKLALDAVEMNTDPAPNLRPQAEQCAASETVNSLYSTGFEGTISDWKSVTLSGTLNACQTTSDNPKSGAQAAFCNNVDSESDTVWQHKNAISLPANAYLHFHHHYLFEPEYDYGLVEYSIDNGVSWQSAHAFYDAGKPSDPAIAGVNSFNGHSLGYVSTRYDLSSLSGKELLLRFRVVSDQFVGAYGWLIDDLSIYTCSTHDTTPDSFSFTTKNNVALNSQQVSNVIRITGIDVATAISITGGEYRINGGHYTSHAGTVLNNDSVQIRHTSSSAYNTPTISTFTVGTVQKTFSTNTLINPGTPLAASGGSGSINGGLLLIITVLGFMVKRKNAET